MVCVSHFGAPGYFLSPMLYVAQFITALIFSKIIFSFATITVILSIYLIVLHSTGKGNLNFFHCNL